MSFVNVDDTSPLFNYKDNLWSSGGISGEFESTHHSTSTGGAQVIFGPFTGSSISVYSTVGTSQPKLHFFVDNDAQNVDLSAISGSGIQFQRQLYSASNLDPTQQHTLQINVLDSGPFTLDFVQIGTTAPGVTTTSTSTTTSTPTPTITTLTTTTFSTRTTTNQVPGTTSSPSTNIVSSTTTSATPTIFPPSTSTQVTQTSQATVPTPQQTQTSSIMSSGTPTSTQSSTETTATEAAALGGGGSSVDGTVVGSVTGAIIFLMLMVVGLVLYLRRRRFQQRRTKEMGGGFWPPTQERRRPTLRVNLSFSGGSQRSVSPFLPTHRPNISDTATNSSLVQTGLTKPLPPPPAHAFLQQDPTDSPIFDIKPRPISGATMTTRVTVGTNVSQRASVPENVYEYPFREPVVPVPALVAGQSAQAAPVCAIPPLKDIDGGALSPSTSSSTSPGETWTNATSFGFANSPTNATNTPVDTIPISLRPGLNSRDTRPVPTTSVSASFPTFAQVSQPLSPVEKSAGAGSYSVPYSYATREQAAMMATTAYRQQRADAEEAYYGSAGTSFDLDVDRVLHQDAGIILDSSLGRRRVDVPPDYNTLRFNL